MPCLELGIIDRGVNFIERAGDGFLVFVVLDSSSTFCCLELSFSSFLGYMRCI